MTVRGYAALFDWSQAGTFGNIYEDVSSQVQRGDVEFSWGRNIDPTSEITLKSSASQGSINLNNYDRRFSPEYTSSPIAGKILPGRAVQFRKLSPTGQLYNLFSGVLDDYDVASDTANTFTADLLDAFGRPGAVTLSTPLYQSIRTGTAIGLVLDAIGWTGPRDLDAGATVIPFWWEEGTDAQSAIDKLVASEGPPAIAYIEGGTFKFRDRHHRLFDARSTTSQGLFTHIVPAGTGPGGDFKMERGTWTYNHGVKTIVNSAIFNVDIRDPTDFQEVWTSEDAIVVPSGTTVTYTINGNDPFFNAITPVIGTDIILNGGALSSVSLSRTSGQTAALFLTASSDAYITRLAVRAVPIPVVRTTQVSAVDAASIASFGPRSWPDDNNPVWCNVYDAQAVANRVIALYASYRPVVLFTIYAINSTYLATLLDLRIGDRVTVRHDPSGVNRDFIVERLAHKITDLNQHRVTLTCVVTEPMQPASAFTFDVSGLGFAQGSFGVNGIDNGAAVMRFDTAGVGFGVGQLGN